MIGCAGEVQTPDYRTIFMTIEGALCFTSRNLQTTGDSPNSVLVPGSLISAADQGDQYRTPLAAASTLRKQGPPHLPIPMALESKLK